MVAAIVYILCFLTSLGCTLLLLRGYARSKTRLLLWTGLCFASMAINNAVLFVDRVMLPNGDLFWLRVFPLFLGLICLLYGLIWEAE